MSLLLPIKKFQGWKKEFRWLSKTNLICMIHKCILFAVVEFPLTIVNKRIDRNDCIFQKEICSYFKLLSTQKKYFGAQIWGKSIVMFKDVFYLKHYFSFKTFFALEIWPAPPIKHLQAKNKIFKYEKHELLKTFFFFAQMYL